MKKSVLIALLFLVISCKKETDESRQIPKLSKVEKKIQKILKTDTILLEEKDNYILANLIDTKIEKDSSKTSRYNLCFYKNKLHYQLKLYFK